MKATRRHPLLLLIILGYLALATIYSVSTPIFEASDEFWHYAYVQHLADGKGLPTLDTSLRLHQVRQEVAQPPLYYMLMAPIATLVSDKQDVASFQRNPHVGMGTPLYKASNRNAFIHTTAEDFPWQGTSLAIHLMRFLSLFMGIAVIVSAYLIARKLVPNSRGCATLAAALVAFNPQFIFFSASVNNDNLTNVLGAITFTYLLYGLNGRFGKYYAPILGVLTSMAILSKPSGLALIPVVGLAFLWIAWRQKSLPALVRDVCLFVVPMAALTGWWFVRNLQLYNDPLAFVVHTAFGGERSASISPFAVLFNEAEGMWNSFWGVFGVFDILEPPYLYWIFDALTVLAILGLMWALARQIRQRAFTSWLSGLTDKSEETPLSVMLIVIIVWIVIIGLALLKWTLTISASQGRLLFPALAAMAALFAFGLWQIPLPKRLVGAVPALALCAITAITPFMVIMPAYARPALITASEMEQIPNPLMVSFDNKMKLLGYKLNTTVVEPGDTLELVLYWQVLEKMDDDYTMYVHLMLGASKSVGQEDTYLGAGAYRTSQLLPGQCFVERHKIVLSPDVKGPTVGHVDVGLYKADTQTKLQAFDGQGRPVDAAPAGNFRVLATSPLNPTPQFKLSANFGNVIELIGGDLASDAVSPGDVLKGTLYWKALQSPDKDYTVFVHLIGPDGLVAQYDALPKNGEYTTPNWKEGDVVDDSFEISVPQHLSNGEYQVVVGLYQGATGTRLGVGDSDSVVLSRVIVR